MSNSCRTEHTSHSLVRPYNQVMNKSLAVAVVVLALVVLACVLPGQPTPVIQCTAPACPDGELYCPGGNCPGGCGTRCRTHTPLPATPTPTDTYPPFMCTAPACQAGEVYYCPSGDCPGGCGTGCATPTPTMQPEDFCQVIVRTPPPEAPTSSTNGTPNPNRRVDPHVAVCVSASELAVGERLALVGQAVDIGQPAWNLSARENGQGDFERIVEISGTGQVSLEGTSRSLLSFIEAQVFNGRVVLHFEAAAPGEVEFILSATGEVHYGYPGPATWSGGASDVMRIIVR
jgi:hypothetical protein